MGSMSMTGHQNSEGFQQLCPRIPAEGSEHTLGLPSSKDTLDFLVIPAGFSAFYLMLFCYHRSGFPISIFMVRGALSPIGVGTWCKRWGKQLATSWGNSLYQLMSTHKQLQQPCKLLYPSPSTLLKRRGKSQLNPNTNKY